MNPKPLSTAIAAAVQGRLPPEVEASANREAMKRELDRIKQLVDAGRLGCIIVTELLDDAGRQVRSTPYGDPSLVLQTAMHIVQRVTRGHDDAPAAPDPQ